MGEIYREFYEHSKEKYNKQDLIDSLTLHFEHPKLMQRLVNLSKDNVDLFSIAENPLYDEITQFDIREKNIQIIAEYIKFQEQRHIKEMIEYRLAKRHISAVSEKYKRCIDIKVKIENPEVL